MPVDHHPVVGICCSGGGIRAASFALGALQVLQRNRVLHRESEWSAKYLSAVSGGSYIVGGMASVQKSIEALDEDSRRMPAFSPGSPEERRLRNRLSYLTRGRGGLAAAIQRVFLGMLINFGLLAATVLIVGVVTGWVYGYLLPQVRGYYGDKKLPHVYDNTNDVPAWLWLGLIAIWVAFEIVSLRRRRRDAAVGRSVFRMLLVIGVGVALAGVAFSDAQQSTHIEPPGWVMVGLLGVLAGAVVTGVIAVSRRGRRSAGWLKTSLMLLAVAGVVAIIAVALPQVLGWMHRNSVGTRMQIAQADDVARQTGRTLPWWSFGGLAAAFGGAVAAAAPIWRMIRTGVTEVSKQPSWIRRLLARLRRPALNLFALIVGPLLVVVGVVWFAYEAAADPPFRPHSSGPALALWATLVGVAVAVLALAWWRADLNSWSLHALYEDRLGEAFGLERCLTASGKEDAVPRAQPLRLADTQPVNFPEVLICATANIGEYGAAPTARNADHFLLSAEKVGGDLTGERPTDEYQTHGFVHDTDLGLMTAVSISGAAVAPEMGRETRRPLRFLLALANVRLGVWLPKPKFLDRLRTSRRRGSRTPGFSYLLLHEMLGITREDDTFGYVTDGGHYDNLGLVELLRRRCDLIWCIDASGDAINTFSTLGGALAMAEAERGVTVDIHPVRDMAPTTDESRFVKQPYCIGTIRYPPADGQGPKEGRLVVVKAGVPEDASWAIRSYHADHNPFPCDPTLDQLYTADRFDAYVELGRFAMQRAWDANSQMPAVSPVRGAQP